MLIRLECMFQCMATASIQVPEAVKGLASNRWKVRKSLPVGMLDMGGVAGIEYRMEEHFEEKCVSYHSNCEYFQILCDII